MKFFEQSRNVAANLLARSRSVWLFALILLAVNLGLVAKLFGVEYLAYTGSIEGTFIAIPRILLKYPGQWAWWPFWSCGLPFELTYLPLEHWVVATFSWLTSSSVARSLHIVSALVYTIGPVTAFCMCWTLSRRSLTSFVATLLYSCVSLSALIIPDISFDTGGPFNPRRLYVLVFWGGNPEVFALALLPIAVAFLWQSIHTKKPTCRILAGIACAAVALSNSFGTMLLAIAALCLMLIYRKTPWWRGPLTLGSIGILTYCWISPWMSPRLIQAVRKSAATTGGDFRYTGTTYISLVLMVIGFVLFLLLLQRLRLERHLQFLWLFAYFPTVIVALWYAARIAIVPQPFRYHLEMDLFLLLPLVFSGATMLSRLPWSARALVVAALLIGCAVQVYNCCRYADHLIRAVDKKSLSEYKIATWLAANRPDARSFLAGSTSFLFNAFTDNQQLLGGHEQYLHNEFIRTLNYILYAGVNYSGPDAEQRDAECSLFWLKAFGVRAISMSGPESTEAYKEKIFAHPHKFDKLKVLWRDQDDVIYEVPGRSDSLAHVIPESCVVTRAPIHGQDVAPAEGFVAALNDPRYPLATFEWRSLSEAVIRTRVQPGQVIAVQESYAPEWEAWSKGRKLRVRADAIGQMVIEPQEVGPVEVTMRFAGGVQQLITRTMSIIATLFAVWQWLR